MRRALAAALSVVLMSPVARAQGEFVQLLPNAGFEDGVEGWGLWPEDTGSKMVVDMDVRHSGKASLRVDAVNAADRAYPNTSTSELKPETLYRVSVYIRRGLRVPEDSVGFSINYRGGEDGRILRQVEPSELTRTPEGEWTRWSGLFYCTPEVTSWQLVLRFRYAVGSVWFDDVQFEELGDPKEMVPDVWTYLPLGVEIGTEPLARYRKHEDSEDEAYQMARRYNSLMFASAYAEDRLRQAERCFAYAGREPDAELRRLFDASEQVLNEAYQAFGRAFKSGEEADRAAFYETANRLERATGALEDAVAAARDSIKPAAPVQLPERLGEQPRDVPPFDGSGRTNRLLVASSNYAYWVEFMRPFGFELRDAGGSGRPKVYTETEADFSNITAICDHAESLGYAGSFGVLLFGTHDGMWAPQWFLDEHADDPDVWKVSWDGCRGGTKGSLHCVDFYHPEVRELIRDYLRKYAGFCKDEPRIYFYETSQEAFGPSFSCEKGRRSTGYGPSATRQFHRWLENEYGTIADLNREWGAAYAAFEAMEQPPDRSVTRREITPLVAEFERFREDTYIDYLKLIYDSIKAGDPTKPVAARHSALLDRINGARIFETCDILGCHNFAPKMQVMNCYLSSLARYNDRDLAYLEDFWGCQEERNRVSDERAQRRGQEKHVCRTFIWGRALQVKWYAYTSGDYLTTYNGNWFNPRYDILTVRYCGPALAVALNRMRNVDWLLTHSEMPQFRVCIWQPSASMRNQARVGLSYGEIMALHQLIYPAGFLYELVPEEYFADGRARLQDFDVVFLPCAEYLAEEQQRRLADYVRRGGTLIAIEPPGVCDQLARPSGLLLREVYGVREAKFDEEQARWRFEAPDARPLGETELLGAKVGEGEAYLSATVLGRALGAEAGKDVLLRLLAERVKRVAYAADAKFEVVPRVTEEGDRYLFVLNPDPDNRATDRVMLDSAIPRDRAATGAVDVSVEGGYPVRVRPEEDGSSIAMTLGPCETAILHLSP